MPDAGFIVGIVGFCAAVISIAYAWRVRRTQRNARVDEIAEAMRRAGTPRAQRERRPRWLRAVDDGKAAAAVVGAGAAAVWMWARYRPRLAAALVTAVTGLTIGTLLLPDRGGDGDGRPDVGGWQPGPSPPAASTAPGGGVERGHLDDGPPPDMGGPNDVGAGPDPPPPTPTPQQPEPEPANDAEREPAAGSAEDDAPNSDSEPVPEGDAEPAPDPPPPDPDPEDPPPDPDAPPDPKDDPDPEPQPDDPADPRCALLVEADLDPVLRAELELLCG